MQKQITGLRAVFILKIIFLSFVSLALKSESAELANVVMDDKINIEANELILNGIGLRKVVRYGFPIKVYVAGLYLKNKTSDHEEILKSQTKKYLVMQFLLAVDRDSIIETFDNSYRGNCFIDCDKRAQQFAELRSHLVSMRKGDQMIFTFLADKLILEVKGANKKRVEIKNAATSTNTLAMFINTNAPPSPELRNALLGL